MKVFQVEAVYGKTVVRYIVLATNAWGAKAETAESTKDADAVYAAEIIAGPCGSMAVLFGPEYKATETYPNGYKAPQGFVQVE